MNAPDSPNQHSHQPPSIAGQEKSTYHHVQYAKLQGVFIVESHLHGRISKDACGSPVVLTSRSYLILRSNRFVAKREKKL